VLERQRYEKMQERLAEDQNKQVEMLQMKEREKELQKVAEMEKGRIEQFTHRPEAKVFGVHEQYLQDQP
jgi:hypothetical protein